MKISLLISSLILAVFICLGWRVQARLHAVTQDHESAVSTAKRLGINADGFPDAGSRSSGTARSLTRSASARAEEGRSAAAKLMVFGNARNDANPDKNPEAFSRYSEGLRAMLDLDEVGLKAMVEAIRANSDLNDRGRSQTLDAVLGVLSLSGGQARSVLALFSGPINIGKEIDPASGQFVVRQLIFALAKEDPVAALKSLNGISAGHPELVDETTRIGLLRGAAAQDPAFAFSVMNEFGLSSNPAAAENIAASAKTSDERRAILESMRLAIAKIPGEQGREATTRGALSGLAPGILDAGFNDATAWLAAANLSAEESAIFASSIPPGNTKGDTGRWIEWMAGKVPADQLAGKTHELMETWTKSDYVAAGTWLSSLSDGPAKAAAVRSYAATVAPYDPAAAAQWGLTLPQGEDRKEVLKAIHGEWLNQDPSAAAKFAEENNILR